MTNPEHTTWYEKDQVVLGALLSSIMEGVLNQVVSCTTAAKVWATLQSTNGCKSQDKVMQLRIQLASLQKKSSTALADYYQKVKGIADTLAAIGEPLKEQEVIAYLLTGLGPDYDSLITSFMTCETLMNLSELYSHLTSHELRQGSNTSTTQINIVLSANQAHLACGYNGHIQGSVRGRGQNTNRDRGRNARECDHRGPSSSNKPICQVCEKRGHTAIRC